MKWRNDYLPSPEINQCRAFAVHANLRTAIFRHKPTAIMLFTYFWPSFFHTNVCHQCSHLMRLEKSPKVLHTHHNRFEIFQSKPENIQIIRQYILDIRNVSHIFQPIQLWDRGCKESFDICHWNWSFASFIPRVVEFLWILGLMCV